MFRDRLDHCREQLAKVGNSVAEEYCFTGFDAYRKLTALQDVNYVILATPPHFRPATLRAAIEAGKHVFAEKPLAVDGPGVRSILESAEIARKKSLGIVCGAQRRHQSSYIETVKRIQDGAIGDIVECRANWNGGGLWVIARQPSMTDMEWQLRNWNYFTWLSGDHIVEQHIHNYDVINWIVGRPPVKATSLGGRQVRTAPEYGNIFDHFATEFEYENGMRLFSTCRQIDGCSGNVSEAMVGTKGTTNCRDFIKGPQQWKYSGPNPNPYQVEHADLIASIRAGKPLNLARSVAESTLMGIMARNSAYTGQTLTWEQVLNSKQDLSPPKYEFGNLPISPVPVPGAYIFE
jgi:predicted dehydrogenase